MRRLRYSGFTLTEILTALVVLVVLIAIAVPMWRTHELRARREDAVRALMALHKAQDEYFGQYARYANETQLAATPPEGLGIADISKLGFYRLSIQVSADGLGYWAHARAMPVEGAPADSRCVELRIDQNGRRFATDAVGADRSADCWK